MAYAFLSLTVVRIIPVVLMLTGMDLSMSEKLFMGWFDPTGLASILFAVIVARENLPGGDTIALAATCTIVLSVLAHGLSANPLVRMLVKKKRLLPVIS